MTGDSVLGMRRSVPVLLACGLLLGGTALVGCGSDGGGSSSTVVDDSSADGSFCSLLLAFRATNATADAEYNSGDPARTEAVMRQLVSQGDLLRRKAPADIKADATAVAAYVTALDGLFSESGYDIDNVVGDEEATAEFVALTTEDVESSLLQLRTYADTSCAAVDGTSTTVAGAVTTVVETSTTVAGG